MNNVNFIITFCFYHLLYRKFMLCRDDEIRFNMHSILSVLSNVIVYVVETSSIPDGKTIFIYKISTWYFVLVC